MLKPHRAGRLGSVNKLLPLKRISSLPVYRFLYFEVDKKFIDGAKDAIDKSGIAIQKTTANDIKIAKGEQRPKGQAIGDQLEILPPLNRVARLGEQLLRSLLMSGG